MTSYSSNANVQTLIYGATNSDLDTQCSSARDVATSIINAKMGLKSDLTTVPDVVTRCTSLLAAGIVSTSPEDKVESNTYWKQGMILLESLGEEVETTNVNNTWTVEGFGRHEEDDEDSAYER
jgi:chaperone required for assembly of F1-ATPase